MNNTVNVLFGPPSHTEDVDSMLEAFFSRDGIHIVCGGTTAQLAASFLGRPLSVGLRYDETGLPPIGHIDGVELVTEGVVTMDAVLGIAKDLCTCGGSSSGGCIRRRVEDALKGRCDGAAEVARYLFVQADEIDLFVGCAQNPADTSAGLVSGRRAAIARELSQCLSKMGKMVFERYF